MENKTLEEMSLEDRLEMETLISGFSSSLIILPPETLEEELGVWLGRLGDFLKIDRIIVFEFSENREQLFLIQSYSSPQVELPPLPRFQDIQVKPESIGPRILQGRVLVAEHIPTDLTEAEQQLPIVQEGYKSFVSIPLVSGNVTLGDMLLLVFQRERGWPPDLVRRLKLIGEIIANAIQRRRSHYALLEEIDRRKRMETRYATILKNTDIGFWITDLDQNILEVNDAYCAMSGFSRAEILSMKIPELEFSQTPAEIQGHLDQLISFGRMHFEGRHRRKDGEAYDIEINVQWLPSERIICTFIRDVTELKRAKAELEERLSFEELIADFSAAIVNLAKKDLETALGVWMKRFAQFLKVDHCTITEYLDDFTRQRHIQSYTHPGFMRASDDMNDKSSVFPAFGAVDFVKNGKYLKLDHIPADFPDETAPAFREAVLKDGTRSLLAVPLKSGELILGVMLFASFTYDRMWSENMVRRIGLVAEIVSNTLTRDRSAEELDRYRNHLEQLVEERSAALVAAQQQALLNERLAALGKLTGIVSHELRNPLGTIRQSLYAIRQLLSEKEPRMERAIDRAERNVSRCDHIIAELLDFTRNRTLSAVPIRIDSWIRQVLKEDPPPKSLTVHRDLGADIILPLDPDRFRRCLINILTNAYQAIEEKKTKTEGFQGHITVSTRVDGGRLELVVEDNGVGFDPAMVPKLFEPLYSTKPHGVGLGVPIINQIVEQHGGTLTIEGVPGAGAKVVIRLPIV